MPPKTVLKKTLKKHRSFLKWAGGKFRLVDEINSLLPKKKSCLIEPFVGAGSVFLNTNFEHYILADINPDLINLFKIIQQDSENYIIAAKALFEHPDANSRVRYYQLRDIFNNSQDAFQRAVIFLYLNRFGFNGLCRYNSNNQVPKRHTRHKDNDRRLASLLFRNGERYAELGIDYLYSGDRYLGGYF